MGGRALASSASPSLTRSILFSTISMGGPSRCAGGCSISSSSSRPCVTSTSATMLSASRIADLTAPIIFPSRRLRFWSTTPGVSSRMSCAGGGDSDVRLATATHALQTKHGYPSTCSALRIDAASRQQRSRLRCVARGAEEATARTGALTAPHKAAGRARHAAPDSPCASRRRARAGASSAPLATRWRVSRPRAH